MAKFTGALSGSLAFMKGGVAQTQLVPGAQSLNLTGSFNITGSQLTFNGRDVMATIDSLQAGANPNIGSLRLHSASINLYTQSNDQRVERLEAVTGSIPNLNAATSSYFLKADSSNIISSSLQIDALGYNRDVISSSAQIYNLGYRKDVLSGSKQILDLGFVTSSDIARYSDLTNVPGGIISSSAQVGTLGYITGSTYLDLVNIPSNIMSGSSQISTNLLDTTVNFGTGLVSASAFKGDGSGLTGIAVDTISSIRSDFDQTGSVSITHSFNTQNVNVTVYDENGFQYIPASTQLVDNNNVKVTFAEYSTGHVVVTVGGHIFSGSVEYSSVLNTPTNLISSSQQISDLGFGGASVVSAGTVSSSAQIIDLGFITGSVYSDIINTPSGIISSSQQITDLSFLTSASAALAGFGEGGASVSPGTVSSSLQIAGLGFITGSVQADVVGLNVFSGSIQSQVDGLLAATSSYAVGSHSDINSLNSFTGSIQSQVNHINSVTGSFLTSAVDGTISGSTQISDLGYITSASAASLGFGSGGSETSAGTISSSLQIINLGFITGSEQSDVTGLNTFTSSIQSTVDGLLAATSSYAVGSHSDISGLNSKTGSYATSGSNTFIGNQIVSGSIIPESSINDLGSALAPFRHLYVTSGSVKFMNPDGTEQSAFNNQFDGNRVVSNTDHPLFNSFNPGSSGTIEDFLTAVFYPNTAPTITTGNQVIEEYTANASSIVTITGTDAESQSITFSIDDSYTDGFVIVDNGVLKLNTVPTATAFNTDNRGDGTLAHPVVLKATDTIGASSTKTIYIRVTPNAAPIFRESSISGNQITSFSTSRNENASSGEVTKVYFTDTESDSITINSGSDLNGHFSIIKYPTYVAINQVTASLDYESITSYNMSITASDAHYEAGQDADSVTSLPITINVTDNTQPTVNNQTLSTINENSSAGTTVGTITATDPEGDTITFKNATLYSLEVDGGEVNTGSYSGTAQLTDPTEDAFTVSSAGVVTRKNGVHLNSDLIDEYKYQVVVTDAYNNGSDTGIITIPISDDTAPSISGDTTLYVIESAVSSNNIYDNSNGYSGTTSRFTSNQTVTWAVSSSNDFNINSNGYLTLARDISGSADVGGDQLSGIVTATNTFGTEATQAFTVNITDNTAPTITFSNVSANQNTNKAVPGNNLVSVSFSDAEGNGIDHNSFVFDDQGNNVSATKSGDTYLIRATSALAAGNYTVGITIADAEGFASRTSTHTFSISQAVVGTLTTNGTFRIIESALDGDEIKITSNGRTGTQADVGVTYSPSYGSQAVSSFTSSNASITVNSSGNLTVGTNLSGSSTSAGDNITSNITFQDQYNNIGSGSVTVLVVANSSPSVTVSEQGSLESDNIANGVLCASVSISDTESDYPITLALSGTNASDFTVTSNNSNGTSWDIDANSALAAGTYTFTVTATDAFGKTGTDTASIVIAQSADYGLVYVYTSTYGSDAGFGANYLGVMGGSTVNSDVPPEVTAYTANTSSPFYKFKSGDVGSTSISLAGGQTATLQTSGSGSDLDSVLSALGTISANTTGQVIIVYPSGSDMTVPTTIQESFNSTAGGAVPCMDVDGNGFGIESGVLHSVTLDSAHLGYSEWFVFGRKSQNAIASGFKMRLVAANGSLPT